MNANKQKQARGFGALAIYETLRNEILSLDMEPGQLVDESSLASRFGVSRSPVREALVRLASEALLQTLPNKGTIVAPLRIQDFPQYVDALDLMQRATTRLAAKLRTEDALNSIKAEQQRHTAYIDAGDVPGMILSNRDFHVAIAKAANNHYLLESYQKLLDDGRRYLRLYFLSFGNELPKKELFCRHDRIIEAIEAQDADLAERMARDDVDEMQQQFLDYLGTRHLKEITADVPPFLGQAI